MFSRINKPLLELFKGKNLSGWLARWYLTILEHWLNFQYVPGHDNVVADALSRNVAAIQEVENLSILQLCVNNTHPLWIRVIYALQVTSHTYLSCLFNFLSLPSILRRYYVSIGLAINSEMPLKKVSHSPADLILHKKIDMLRKTLYDIYVLSNRLINF